jgi:transcriptional regulator with XRE-family HTH domain
MAEYGATAKFEHVGAVLRAERERAGMSLEAVASQLGWSRSRLSKYETDKLSISTTDMAQIARALRMRPEALALKCLIQRYPALAEPHSEIGRLLQQLVDLLE